MIIVRNEFITAVSDVIEPDQKFTIDKINNEHLSNI